MKIRTWIVICVLFLQVVHIEQVYSESRYSYEWTLEPKTTGSVHVKAKITIGDSLPYMGFSYAKTVSVKNMKAWEAETENPINVKETDGGHYIEYTFEFDETKKEGFQFFVEYDLLKRVQEKDDIYSLYWGWEFPLEASHTATVILPKNHELLDTEHLDPVKVSSHQNQVTATFEEDVPEAGTFKFLVVFSQKGVQLLEEAEEMFGKGEFAEAKKTYQEAREFYFQYTDVYGRDIATLLVDLTHYAKECDLKLAEEKYGEAVAAFNNEEYETAQQLFQEAQDMYQTAGDTEKFNECQEFVDQCAQLLEEGQLRSEAEALLSEGVTYYEQQQYTEAKAKFEEALAKFTELQDQEKITECQEWIASCEKGGETGENGGPCLGSTLVFAAMLGAALVSMYKSGRNA